MNRSIKLKIITLKSHIPKHVSSHYLTALQNYTLFSRITFRSGGVSIKYTSRDALMDSNQLFLVYVLYYIARVAFFILIISILLPFSILDTNYTYTTEAF